MVHVKNTDTPEAWIVGIAALHEKLIRVCCEEGESIETDEEKWSISDFKYSEERHKLTIEFDDGEFWMDFEYSEKFESLTVTAWKNRRIVSMETDPNSDDEGRDEDSVRVIQLIYLLKMGTRAKPKRSLAFHDPSYDFSFARPEEVALFSYLVGRLEKYASYPIKNSFDFQKVKEYAKKQQILSDSFQLMRRGMIDMWQDMEKDWDSFSD